MGNRCVRAQEPAASRKSVDDRADIVAEGDDAPSGREMWLAIEPFHAVIYFAKEAVEHFRALGLKDYWTGCVASRVAPLGAIAPHVATACFVTFHPRMLERALPRAWEQARPEQVTAARFSAADETLRRLLGTSTLRSKEMGEAAEIIRDAAGACRFEGRPLAAAYASLDWPTAPHLVLWHGTTVLREHRHDGHSAALLAAGLDGCEASVGLAATGVVSREALQPHRGWSDAEWEAAAQRLRSRGWIDDGGKVTALGAESLAMIEDTTDSLATCSWESVGVDAATRFHALLSGWSRGIRRRGGIPPFFDPTLLAS